MLFFTILVAVPEVRAVLLLVLQTYLNKRPSAVRGVWPSYFAEVHGVVFVVDAADASRMREAATELEQVCAWV